MILDYFINFEQYEKNSTPPFSNSKRKVKKLKSKFNKAIKRNDGSCTAVLVYMYIYVQGNNHNERERALSAYMKFLKL